MGCRRYRLRYLTRIENEVIPRAIHWAKASGAEFEKSKTELIHFTRHALKNPQPYRAILFETTYIAPQDPLKLLGVTLDQQLQMRGHLTNSTAKDIQQYLAIKHLRGIKLKAIHQLYSTAVTSITDYAATVWYKPYVSYPLLEQVQRLGGQAITKAFRSVSLPILEAEA